MKINDIKDAIREQLNSCNDREQLLDALVKLIPDPQRSVSTTYAEEPETKYGNIVAVPEAHYKLLKEDWELFKKGKIKAKPLEEVMSRLSQKHQS
ncbi:MAG TPA: hypothetical protein ENH91_10340 [Leeuwenhoekiella sp.]|nr:hypothetical protein [Leeuwenhoekiella sp.]